jgi:hypothetical protein
MAERCPQLFTSDTCDWTFWRNAVQRWKTEWYEDIDDTGQFVGWKKVADDEEVTYSEFREWAKSIY